MVSEAEILTLFLLERVDLTTCFSLEKLRKHFPKDTPQDLLGDVHSLLAKRFTKRLDTVNSVIHSVSEHESEGLTILQRQDQAILTEFPQLLNKMETICSLLDSEITDLEENVGENEQLLQSAIDQLKDVVIPTVEVMNDKAISTVLELMETLQTLH